MNDWLLTGTGIIAFGTVALLAWWIGRALAIARVHLGLYAMLVAWHVQWRERRYDRARAKYKQAADRAEAFIDRHEDVFRA